MPNARPPDDEDPAPPEAPTFVLSRDAVREVDRLAAEGYRIPSIVLMENAAIALREEALRLLGGGAVRPAGTERRAAIVCGPGNNGGDGLALARHLYNAGVEVGIILAVPPERYAGDALTNLRIVEAMGLPLAVLDPGDPGGSAEQLLAGHQGVIVDALLGTGLREPVRSPILELIRQINAARTRTRRPVLAVDVPSGLDADTGEPLGEAVHADATVTFVGVKPGFLTLTGQEYLGEVVVAGIGAPRELTERLGRPAGVGWPAGRKAMERPSEDESHEDEPSLHPGDDREDD